MQRKKRIIATVVCTTLGILFSATLRASQVEVHIALGNKYVQKDRLKDALEEYGKAVRINPKAEIAIYNEGFVFFYLNKLDHAKERFLKAVEINKTFSQALCGLGGVAFAQKQWRQAESYFRKALSYNQNEAVAHHYLGEIPTWRDNTPGELDEYVKAFSSRALIPKIPGPLAPKEVLTAKDYYLTGTELKNGGLLEEAALSFISALELDPGMLDASLDLARLYLMQGNMYRALTLCNDILSDNPSESSVLKTLASIFSDSGELLYARGHLRNAEKVFEKATQADPYNAALFFRLAVLQMEMGKKAKARMNFEKTLLLDPDYSEARWMLDKLSGVQIFFKYKKGDLFRYRFKADSSVKNPAAAIYTSSVFAVLSSIVQEVNPRGDAIVNETVEQYRETITPKENRANENKLQGKSYRYVAKIDGSYSKLKTDFYTAFLNWQDLLSPVKPPAGKLKAGDSWVWREKTLPSAGHPGVFSEINYEVQSFVYHRGKPCLKLFSSMSEEYVTRIKKGPRQIVQKTKVEGRGEIFFAYREGVVLDSRTDLSLQQDIQSAALTGKLSASLKLLGAKNTLL